MARHYRSGGFSHLQGRPSRLWADGGRLFRYSRAERLSPPLFWCRLANGARRRFRSTGPPKHRQPRRLYRRADPQQRRHYRVARGVPCRLKAEMRRTRHAADPRRSADRDGSTGTMFAFERDGVVPDILVLSKTLGAGLPLAAVMTTDEISQAADDRGFLFYTTHVNEPLPAMVGLKVIEVVQRDGLAALAAELGDCLKRGLLSLKQKYPCIGDVRGRGLLLGVEFRALDRNENHSARALSDAVTDRALHLGLSANIVRTGASDGVMRIAPPLTATDAEIDLGVELLDAALEQTPENLRPVREAPTLACVGAR